MLKTFYIARLIDADDSLLASEQVWRGDDASDADFTPERVALEAAGFFNTDDHAENPEGCTIQLFGPFTVADAPAHIFKIEDAEDDARDFWTAERIGGDACGVTLDDVLRDWPGGANSDADTLEWCIECQQALLRRVARGEGARIDYEAIGLKNAQILDLGDAVEDGDSEAEHERHLLRREVANLCKGLG